VPLRADEIETKEFLTTLRGFDKEEVRAFLQVIAADHRKSTERITELEQTVARAVSYIEELHRDIRALGGTPTERSF
jgi:DivIVA domain-containing protein